MVAPALPGDHAPAWVEALVTAQAFAHTTGARRYLAMVGAAAAGGQWPDRPIEITPGVPGPADASVEQLRILLAKSRRSMASSAAAIEGHETDPCPVDHPLVGHRLRCGEWLLYWDRSE